MRAINRKLLLLAMIVFTIAICYKVSSYTYAKVESNLNFSINSSENALIAMPEDIVLNANKLITITTMLLDKADYIKYEDDYKGNETSIVELSFNKKEKIYMVKKMTERIELTGNNFYIKNNMNQTITVSSNSAGIIYFDNISIAPGGTWYVPCSVGLGQENQDIDITITAKWQEGTANIYKKISLKVKTVYKNIEVDLRKPKKEEKIILPKESDLEKPMVNDKNDESKDKIENKDNKDKDREENKDNDANKENKDNEANKDIDDNKANKVKDNSEEYTDIEDNENNAENIDNMIDDESEIRNDSFDPHEDEVIQVLNISKDINKEETIRSEIVEEKDQQNKDKIQKEELPSNSLEDEL